MAPVRDAKPFVQISGSYQMWQYAIDQQYDNRVYSSEEEAEEAAFQELLDRGYSPEQALHCRWRSTTLINYPTEAPRALSRVELFHILEMQEAIRAAGWQWTEHIYNDESYNDCFIVFTRSKDPCALSGYPRPADTVGWGRFPRFDAWHQAHAHLMARSKAPLPAPQGATPAPVPGESGTT